MKVLFACFFFSLFLSTIARSSTLPPGLYERNGHQIYVGVENEQPNPPSNESFDPATRHLDSVLSGEHVHPVRTIREEQRIVFAPEGRLGMSLYYANGHRRATVVLIHGNDPETRAMGFIIPFFVLHGINVISYDQRGTGDSPGNWFLDGPAQRAVDVIAIYDSFRNDPHVDARRMGVWGFSNGGWTAPIVATKRPFAFMILKSAPAESLKSNLHYEVVQQMLRHGESAAAIEEALALWRAVEGGLDGTISWNKVQHTYTNAAAQPWFAHSLMLKTTFPPAPAFSAGLRRALSYDPAATLRGVRTQTLALYGALDRNVDVADSSKRIADDFAYAGMRDFTIHVYLHAGHTLIVSADGFTPRVPKRYTASYPQVMIDWLAHRGFLK